MRQKLADMTPKQISLSWNLWSANAAAKQRVLDKKEEAWEVFRRLSNVDHTREEFERQFERRVTSTFASIDSEDKSLQQWITELRPEASAEDRRKEAQEREAMKREDAASQ